MAFNVSYRFIAQNQFSAVARKVKDSAVAVKRKMGELGASVQRLGPKFDKLKAKMTAIGRSARDAGKKMTLFATLPIALVGRSLIKAASDAEETRAKFNTVFRDIATQSNKTADDLAKNFGLSGSGARELLGDTGDLLTGFGFTQQSALDLSTQVNKLAVDLASFTNFSGGAKGASQALTKALLGERESIKSLGISILEEDVKARVKQLVVVDKMKFATLRQAKAFATLQLAQEQSKNAIGDFARTSAGFANQQRIFGARIQDLSEKLGNILLPTANKIVGVFIRLTEKFTNLSTTTQKIILTVGGIVAVAGPLLFLFGAIVAIIPAMVTGFALIGGALALITLPMVLIAAGIIALIAAGVFLIKNWENIKAALSPIIDLIVADFNAMLASFNVVADAIKAQFDNLVNAISGKIDAFVEKILQIKNLIGGFFEDAGQRISTFFGVGDQQINQTIENNQALISESRSRADVNVNLRAPEGVVESVKTQRSGDQKAMNLGVNMAVAG